MKMKLLLTFLACAAVVLGIAVSRQSVPASNEASSFEPVSQITPLSESPQQEGDVLNVPGPDSSQEERARYGKLIAGVEKESFSVTLTNCLPDPLVLLVKEGSTFTILNRDAEEHTLTFAGEPIYIAANSSQKVVADFGRGQGFYGYTCDGAPGSSGVFHVIMP